MADYDPSDPAIYNGTDVSFNPAEAQYDQHDSEEEEDDDYDPSSFTFDPSAGDAQSTELMQTDQDDAPATIQQSPKPKTIGGFIVDDEEDDEDEEEQIPPPSQLNGTEGAQSGLGAAAASNATEITMAQDVPIASEPHDTAAVPSAQTDTQSARLNGSTPTPVVPVPDPTAAFVSSNASIPAAAPPVQSPPSPASAPGQGKQEAYSSIAESTAQPATVTPQPPASAVAAAPPTVQTNGVLPPTLSTQRLPHDKVGQLEDRIKEDPKGDIEAWRSLIAHYREKSQLDNARKVYTRFFEVFPQAAPMWVEYAQMELEQDQLRNVEQIFGLSLLQLPNVEMWNVYLDYLRRIHPLINDTDGSKRGIISAAFDLLLDNVGIDPDAGKLWRDYIDFLKTGPGIVGGTGWQDAQKSDLLRKAYQRAVKLPHSELVRLWKEYDNFELSMNKATGRKYLQEQSPHYMTARTAKTQMDQRLEGLDRRSLPKLPPVFGCAGDDEFAAQVQKWRSWVEWEKEDPLVFREEDIATLRKRVLYAYKQATMQLRFYPEIWFEAASWCFSEGTEEMVAKGEEFLSQGIEANPESVLLALMKADRVESSLEAGNTEEVAMRNAKALDAVFENVHQPLYALHKKTQDRIKREVARIQEYFASLTPEMDELAEEAGDDNASDVSSNAKPKTRAQKMQDQIDAYTSAMAERQEELKRTISYMWVAKMRAFRRLQGQGQPVGKDDAGKGKKGLRGVFGEARPRGQLTSAVYIASAQMEWFCYKDPSASKIFDRGHKLFPLDEVFTLEYIKHLVNTNDHVNARAIFETTITKITNADKISLDERRRKCRPLLEYMHEFESNYGDLDKIHKLENRMATMYLDEPEIARFGARNALPSFDAIRVQLIISPTQVAPKTTSQMIAPQQPVPSIEQPRSPPETSNIRLGPNGPYIASPKRGLDDSDTEGTGPQRKFMRGESPLKGAAGRRVATGAATLPGSGAAAGGAGFVTKSYVPTNLPPVPAGPAPLPSQVQHLLEILPRAGLYNVSVFDAAKMVELLRGINLPKA